jgi:hypothetical protein
VRLNCRENLLQKGFSRLARMRQLATFAVTLTLATAAAVALASCGGEDAKLLPGTTAQEITENLDTVQQLAAEGECVGAADAAEEVSNEVEALGGVDPKLKQALQRGAARLSEVVTTCEEEDAEAVAPAAEAPEAEETTEVPPGQEKKAEKELEKEEEKAEKEAEKEAPAEAPTTETPPTEPPPTTTTPSEGGGTGAPGGVSPGTPVGPEGE